MAVYILYYTYNDKPAKAYIHAGHATLKMKHNNGVYYVREVDLDNHVSIWYTEDEWFNRSRGELS